MTSYIVWCGKVYMWTAYVCVYVLACKCMCVCINASACLSVWQ